MKHLRILLISLVLLAGCGGHTYDLDPKWAPLEMIKQKPSLTTLVVANMATTIGNTLYVDNLKDFLERHKPGSRSFNILMTHERVHAIRETAGIPIISNIIWLIKYVFSTDFMWEEERLAAYFDYKVGIRKSASDAAKVFSERYFNIFGIPMVDYDEALQWVKDARSGVWKPDLTDEEYDFYKAPR